LRAELANRTEIGRIAADYLKRGDLVPDELVFEMLAAPALEAAGHGGYGLDGFPRTLRQAEEAYRIAHEAAGIELQAVVHLTVGHDGCATDSGLGSNGKVALTTPSLALHTVSKCSTHKRSRSSVSTPDALLVDINGEQPVQKVFAYITAAIDRLRAGQN
jgi:adenylate kinase